MNSSGGRARRLSGSGARILVAVGVGLVVTLLALRGMVPAGAGVYYDDGVYLALAHSLAGGEGYVYANLPGAVPGVKYPPLYPALLAAALEVLPAYPDNLGALKALNALLTGLAAALSLLVFAAGWTAPHAGGTGDAGASGFARPDVVLPDADRRRSISGSVALGVLAVATLLAYGSAQTMVLATALLSEPLFLVAAFATLGLAGRRNTHPALLGVLAAAAFLVRGIGVAVVGALIAAELLRRGTRPKRRGKRLAWFAAGVLPPVGAWIAWSAARSDAVPEPLAGPYGAYASWYAAGDASLLARLREVAAAHWTPFLSNLEMLWIPDAAETTANFVLAVLAVVTLVGAVRIARRNLALALFPFVYLLVVVAWPYEPDRFFYAILPALTLLLAAGGLALTERIREDMPRWGAPAAAVVGGVLLFNSVAYEVDVHAQRAWTIFQAAPATAYAPLNDWIRENTAPDAVVASGLDPHVYWETGRTAVPNFQFLAADYGRYDVSAETLARDFERIRAASGARWVAVIRGHGKAGDTMAAFAETHPERSRLAYEAEAAGVTGEVWEVLPPGEAFEGEGADGP